MTQRAILLPAGRRFTPALRSFANRDVSMDTEASARRASEVNYPCALFGYHANSGFVI
jgi:hypothetical protein